MSWSWTEAAIGRDAAKALPKGWGQIRVADISQIVNGAPYDSKHFGDLGEPLLRIRDLVAQQVETRYDGPELTGYRVTGDSLLVGMDGDFNVGRWALGEPALLNQRVLAIETDPLWSKWIEYCLPPALKVINDLTYATTVKHLSSVDVSKIRIPNPPEELLQPIADYLDHETAEIDAAISDQIALIELLEERQRIQKYQLVTGQTLAMPRAAEVVRFWAELPLDWSLQKLQWHFDIGNGSTPSTSTARFWDQDGFPWLNSSVVNEPSVVHPSRRVSQTALEELHLPIVPPGSLLMGITGQGKTRGMVTPLDIEATINQHLAYLTPRSPQGPISVEYLRLALDVAYPELRQLSDGNGGTKGALTCHMLQQFRVPVPPKNLQAALVTEARRETAATAQAVADAESFIALARERRAALITAAVTGQIDVTARHKPAAEQLEDDIAQGLHGEN
ncbi:restriction endonuclease subunit S [Kocuria rhizophila]|uniref:restriction endonuclease subunit S n=1 Tax=Kocuria rhizophila TaxID=72000 RepID=UPI001EF528D3|nr:restriction endonuclease subunit S [Kocuria rhizophila]MCG7425935.1 restriction endonuclease subunit S [Kocuria rhizophila]MCT1457126.1 restriction endonuclease subunit S [Kocuria rhizophila]MCT1880197.1 restriction endonuclease subunit S [Kocuria rhizophila]MCT2248633.1 restriction endonuclease subunit S [Kocuria rhizophila]